MQTGGSSLSSSGMIETAIPEINVQELMERVRAEAKRPRPSPRQPIAPVLPPTAMLPSAPTVWIPGPVKSNQERLERVLETAREKNDGESWLPKFLRRFFRKQGGYNRAVLDGISTLAKSNQDLTRRLADVTVCLGQLNGWLLALHEQSDADAAWMKLAAPEITRISALESTLSLVRGEVATIGQEFRAGQAQLASNYVKGNDMAAALQKRLEELRHEFEKGHAAFSSIAEQANAAAKEAVAHARNLEGQFAEASATVHQASSKVQEQIDHMGRHLRNLQTETAGVGEGLQSEIENAAIHLRNLQGQTDRLGLHINNLQGLVDKQAAEQSATCRGLEQRLNDHAGLAQKISAVEERMTADVALVKGELSEYGTFFRQLLGKRLDHAAPAEKAAAAPRTADKVPGIDSFYLAFENRFRGPRSDIKKRVEILPPFSAEVSRGQFRATCAGSRMRARRMAGVVERAQAECSRG